MDQIFVTNETCDTCGRATKLCEALRSSSAQIGRSHRVPTPERGRHPGHCRGEDSRIPRCVTMGSIWVHWIGHVETMVSSSRSQQKSWVHPPWNIQVLKLRWFWTWEETAPGRIQEGLRETLRQGWFSDWQWLAVTVQCVKLLGCIHDSWCISSYLVNILETLQWSSMK